MSDVVREGTRHREQAFPRLDRGKIERVARFAKRRRVEKNEVLFEQGERNTHVFVVVSGRLEVIRPTERGTEELVRVHGPGEFSGEVSVLLGQRSVVLGRMREAGEVLSLDRAEMRHLVIADPDLGELFFRAFILRRMKLIAHHKGDVVLVGSNHSANTLRLREFLFRNGYPFSYLDVDAHAGGSELLERFGVGVDEVPVAICRGEIVLRNPTNSELAGAIGLRPDLDPSVVRDVVIVGAGPAGLASAVYAASEGLDVVVLESVAPGGQAGSSSKIENYLGFPMGISGDELARRAFAQAAKFGAEIAVASSAARLVCTRRPYRITMDGAEPVQARVVVIACGARYRKLALPELERFENAGVYYAATAMEAQLCRGEEVIVVGGGNSAGQAAVFLSQRVRQLHMLVRSGELKETMSNYLVRRIEESRNITVRLHSEITALLGLDKLEEVRITNNLTNASETRAIRHVFLMTGAVPNTDWLGDCVALDDRGFIKTGADLQPEDLVKAGWPFERPPHGLESSLPGVFAVGDARAGSVKRVAAAVGEGSACVQLIHQVLKE